MTTGAAATSRCARRYTAAATRSNTTPTKNTRRPSQRPSRRARTTRWIYAAALFDDDDATLDDLREAVTTLEDTERIARRVLGGTHPTTASVERNLGDVRAALRAREGSRSVCEAMAATTLRDT